NGTNGTNGTNGATNVVVRTIVVANQAPGSTADETVPCNTGERATGGGATYGGISDKTLVNASFPTKGGSTPATAGQTPDGWQSFLTNNTAVTLTATFYAICASP